MIERIKQRVERARFYAEVVRITGLVRPVRPTSLARFARQALRTKLGPHVALMFHAAANPDKEALVEYAVDGSVHRLTWGDLDATINRAADALADRGVRSGERVALMLPNGIAYLIAQQALARIGATAVQIGYRSKAGEIVYILDNAEPRVTIVDGSLVAVMREARAQTGKGGPLLVVADDRASGGLDDAEIPWDRALDEASPALRRPAARAA